jgi:GTP pyrophosphokinase
MNEPAHKVEPPPANQHADRYLISDLCNQLEHRFDKGQVRDVYRAYLFAADAHSGQSRLTGEPYIFHPLSVARTLADMNMDADSIIAAILHDVLEDTTADKDQIAAEFGNEVAKLVDAVSKLTHLTFESKLEAQAANFRKMVLAMVDDIRVILIKLADRLHNMRTLGALSPKKRRRIARETLDIYAPIANRLGIYTMREELEALGFAVLYPMRYRILNNAVKKARGNRKELMQKIEIVISAALEDHQFSAAVTGREKRVHSIYQKMRTKRLSFQEVFDMFAIRVVVHTVDECYRAMGVLHGLYKPMPTRFKDYIAIPKANGYQSLHTVLVGAQGVPIEVQIRTEEMDRFAESGVAAHWLYKSGINGGTAQLRAREWLKGLLDMQQNADSSVDFLENVKVDLFPDEIYVFSPRGDIYQLPRNATAVDFAYAIHSDIGHTCVAAKIDRRLAPLGTLLETGQYVEVITAPGSRPSPLWLNFVVTAKARTSIRHFLKNLKREEALDFGRRLMERALAKFSLSLAEVDAEALSSLLQEFGYKREEDLWTDIGLGKRIATLVAKRLLPPDARDAGAAGKKGGLRPLAIKGTEGLVVSFPRCCHPIPGDSIQGFLSAGKGIVVHRSSCPNVADFRRNPDKWIQVEWAPVPGGEFTTKVHVEVVNRRGVLAKIASIISEFDSNIENLEYDSGDGLASLITFVITVKDRKHLASIIRSLRNRAVVMRVRRAAH